MKSIYLGVVLAVAVGVYGCGDGNGSGSGSGGTDFDNDAAEAQAQDLAAQTGDDLQAMSDSPDEGTAVGTAFAIYGKALSIASAAADAALVANIDAAALPTEAPELTSPECVTTTADKVTWDNCDFGAYQIDGTVQVSGDQIIVDFSIALSSVTNSFDGTITVTPTSIDGSLNIKSVVASVGFELDVDFDQIVLTAGCPTGGSLTVHPAASAGPIRTVHAAFGPACGDVQLSED